MNLYEKHAKNLLRTETFKLVNGELVPQEKPKRTGHQVPPPETLPRGFWCKGRAATASQRENQKRIIEQCVEITVTPEELASAAGWMQSGIGDLEAKKLVEKLIARARHEMIARTLGL